ncbi:MAG TPA: DinB family protein, partial [Acidobacteriaceae bacterium]|nr:DinB family protein [Acidobacteriaceae bacterium]
MSDSPAPQAQSHTEPWMRGTHTEVPAPARAVIHALELSLEDITRWTRTLTDAEVHSQPLSLPSIAFHLRHIARSVDRILTYAEGSQLAPEQLAALKSEQVSNEEPLPALLAELEGSFHNAFERIRALASADYETP